MRVVIVEAVHGPDEVGPAAVEVPGGPAGRPGGGRAFYGPLTVTECEAPAVLSLAS